MDNPYQAPTAELGDVPVDVEAVDILDLTPASSWQRFIANFIDSLIVTPFTVGVVVVAFLVLGEETADAIPSQVYGLVTMIPSAIAFGMIEGSSWQASPGKKLLGLRVVRDTGEAVDSSTAIKRNMAKYVGLGICGFLAFSVLGGEGRSIWDNYATTRVMKRNPYA